MAMAVIVVVMTVVLEITTDGMHYFNRLRLYNSFCFPDWQFVEMPSLFECCFVVSFLFGGLLLLLVYDIVTLMLSGL